jgi:hypothetical protein
MPDAAGRGVPNALAAWMQPFQGAFRAPTWRHVLVLVMGAILGLQSPGPLGGVVAMSNPPTAFMESAVNEIIAKRMIKKQTSCSFPARGNLRKGSKARALPWFSPPLYPSQFW